MWSIAIKTFNHCPALIIAVVVVVAVAVIINNWEEEQVNCTIFNIVYPLNQMREYFSKTQVKPMNPYILVVCYALLWPESNNCKIKYTKTQIRQKSAPRTPQQANQSM